MVVKELTADNPLDVWSFGSGYGEEKYISLSRASSLTELLVWLKCASLDYVAICARRRYHECCIVNPLYNDTHYNCKILYNVILICMEWLCCSKYVFITTANLV